MAETRGDNEPSMEEILASIRRIISEDTDGRRTLGGGGREGEVLDLTEMLTADGSVVSLASRRPGIGTPADTASPPKESARLEPERKEGTPAVFDRSEKERKPVMSEAEARATMISDSTLEASTTSLGRLAKAARREAALRAFSGEDDRRIEDLLRESLAVLLKDWLDRHLPDMVDRIVREEIEKMVRRIQET